MPANVNPESGIPYGVISGHSVPNLYAEIMNRGVNERLEARDEEVRTTIRSLCNDMLDKRDIDEVIDHILEKANDAEACAGGSDIECYSYTDENGNQFRLGELGGAPIIWCIKTDTIVEARRCSPCVVNAGDLDNLDKVSGIRCYGVPVEYLGEES